MRNLGDIWDMDYDMVKICRHAVDRSSGALLHINIEYFGTDDLLLYIADRSTQLKSLRLVFCQNISDEGLIAAASKIPLLEELDLSYCSFSKVALEKVGHCCPLLRSFKLNTTGYRYPCIECDDEALAVAESMPGLRHLQMFGNKLTNDGLQAILDACLYLESLDLRRCFNVILAKICGSLTIPLMTIHLILDFLTFYGLMRKTTLVDFLTLISCLMTITMSSHLAVILLRFMTKKMGGFSEAVEVSTDE